MLYDMVAEFFGVENDANLQTAIDNSGVSIIDWLGEDGQPDAQARQRIVDAMNKQTDEMIKAEMASGANKMSLVDMLFQLSQMPGITVSGLPNRKSRRAAKKKA